MSLEKGSKVARRESKVESQSSKRELILRNRSSLHAIGAAFPIQIGDARLPLGHRA